MQLKNAGYDGLTIGIETGDDEALTFMHKGYTLNDIVLQCQRLDRAGISYNSSILQGYPVQEKERQERKKQRKYAISCTLKS